MHLTRKNYISRSHPDAGAISLVRAMFAGEGRVRELELEGARRASRSYAVAFSYARTAIVALLESLDRKPGSVLMPAYTCSAVANAIVASGAAPRFVDIRDDDCNIDVERIEKGNRGSVVIPTNMFGARADLPALRDIVGPSGFIIEDACLSIASSRPPHFADASIFSFAIGKELCCFGGGLVATDDERLYQRLKSYRNSRCRSGGWVASAQKAFTALVSLAAYNRVLYSIAYSAYHSSTWFRKYRSKTSLMSRDMPQDAWVSLTEFQAAIALTKYQQLDQTHGRLDDIATIYRERLTDIAGLRLPYFGGSGSHYVIRVPDRQRLLAELSATGLSIGQSMDYDYVVPETPAFAGMGFGDQYPVAARVSRQCINLPFHVRLSDDEVEFVCDRLREGTQNIPVQYPD